MRWNTISTAPRDGTEVIASQFVGDLLSWAVNTSWLDLSSEDSRQAEDGYWLCEAQQGVPTHWVAMPQKSAG